MLASAALLWGAASFAPRPALAQIVTLEEIEAKAQRPRPELAERQAGIERAQAELGVVNSASAPTLGARADVALAPGGQLIEFEPVPGGDAYLVQGSRTLGESEAFLPQPRYGAVLAGKLTLLDFGRTRLGVRAAESAISAERASLIQAKVELVQRARAAYLTWLEAHQTWQLAERDAEVTAARTVSVRELIAEGARPATDATLSAYDEQLARLRQKRAERAVAAALQALAAAIQNELPARAVPDLDVLEAADALPSASAEAAPAAGGAASAKGNARGDADDPALTALERQHQAALSAARAADRGSAPVLDASAELGIQGQDDQIFPVYRAALSLSIPLWDGGRQSAEAAVHRAEAHGIEARLRALERGLRAQRDAAQSRYRSASAELRLSLELLATAELLLSEAEAHYRAGSDTLERVLGAQRSLVAARREVLTAQLETARARLELTPVKVTR